MRILHFNRSGDSGKSLENLAKFGVVTRRLYFFLLLFITHFGQNSRPGESDSYTYLEEYNPHECPAWYIRALLDSRCWSVTDVALDHMASVAR